MKFKKLITLLSAFPKQWLKEFKTSPLSPFGITRPQVQVLFDYFAGSHKMTIEMFAKKNKIAVKRLPDLGNKLLTALEIYGANKTAGKHLTGIAVDIYLLQFYSELRLWENHAFVKHRFEKNLHDVALFPQDFYTLYQYYKEIAIDNKYKNQRTDNEDIKPILKNLDLFYIYERLVYEIEIYMRKGTVDANNYVLSESPLEILALIHNTVPTINILSRILALLKNNYKNLENNYIEIKKLFLSITSIDNYNDVEIKTLVGFMLNICIEAINAQNTFYAQEYLYFIDFLENKGLLLEKGYLPLSKFKNAISAALILGDTIWAEKFVDSKKGLLQIDDKKVVIPYYYATIELEKGNFDKAYSQIPISQLSKLVDVYLGLSTHKLWLKILLHKNELSQFQIEIQKFYKHLQKAKIGLDKKQAYEKFIYYASKLPKQMSLRTISKLEKDTVLDKAWLLKMAQKRKK
jgi:hypothetical protein